MSDNNLRNQWCWDLCWIKNQLSRVASRAALLGASPGGAAPGLPACLPQKNSQQMGSKEDIFVLSAIVAEELISMLVFLWVQSYCNQRYCEVPL